MLDYIDLGEEISRFAHQKFPRLKRQGQFFAVVFAKRLKPLPKFLSQFFDIGLNIIGMIRHLKSTPKIQKLKIVKGLCGGKQNFSRMQKHIDIENITARVHVNPIDAHACIFDNPNNMWQLMDADPKFGVDMSHRNISIATCHHMGIDANTYGNIRVFAPKLLE